MLYFITGNKNKFIEVQAVIQDIQQLDIDLPELQEIDAHKIIQAKLLEARKHYEGAFIVEDTSLYLDCLNGLPGPLIKWVLQKMGNEGLFEIAKIFDNYGATAKTLIGYGDSKGDIKFFEGILKGTIIKPQVESDFGRSPIFCPDGYDCSYAEISIEKKILGVGGDKHGINGNIFWIIKNSQLFSGLLYIF